MMNCSKPYIQVAVALLLFGTSTACVFRGKNPQTEQRELRTRLFGKAFSNKDVQSVDVLEISHPMLGEVIDSVKLSPIQQEVLLSELDEVSYKGIYKCMSRYVIRFNFVHDTLRLKVCGDLIAHRNRDDYFEFTDGEKTIRKLLHP